MTFLLNPKNLLILILAVLIAAVSGMYLWQRGTLKDKENVITRQAADITALSNINADLLGQVADYKAAVTAAKKTQKQQQRIADITATLQTQIVEVKTACVLEDQDEKTLSDITYFFNSRGLRRSAGETGNSDSETGGKILSTADQARPDRPRWTVQQIVANYLTIIDYTLQLERTVECYKKPFSTTE